MTEAFVSESERAPALPDVPPSPGPDEAEEQAPEPQLALWQPTLGERVREAWDSRHLLGPVARSAIPTFRGRILGRAWLFIRPFMTIFGFAVILGGVFHATAPNGVPYILFLAFGLQAFRFFELTLMYETVGSKLVKHQVRRLRLPMLLIPFATLSRVFVFISVYWVILAGLLLYYALRDQLYLELGPGLLVGFAGLALLMLLGLALGLFTSVIYPRAKDMRIFVRYITSLLLLFTPVLYSIEALPERYQGLAQVNPLTPLVGMVQYGFLDAGGLRVRGILWSISFLLVVGAVGLWFFNRFATRWIGVYQVTDTEDDDDEGLL